MHIFANISLILSCAYLTTPFVLRFKQLIHNFKINPEQFRKKIKCIDIDMLLDFEKSYDT